MLATREELLEKLRLGEDTFLELKEVRFAGGRVRGPSQVDLADELAAFANSKGGVLLLGVNDSREIVGIPAEQLDDVERLALQACENSIDPPISPVIERITLPDQDGIEHPLLRIEIEQSLFVHRSKNGFLRRVGSSKRSIPTDELARLFQHRSHSRFLRFDETPVPRAVLDDLDEPLCHRFLTSRTLDELNDILSKLGMAAADSQGILRPTVAGLLLACRNPEEFIPGALIQAVAYSGSEIARRVENAYQRDARDIVGTADSQIFSACDFVRANMRIGAWKSRTGGRRDLPQFDMMAVFEAVANAVAHRDYSMHGSKIRLRVFDNRLEIYSPGSLPNTMTPESLPYRQAARNEVVSGLLSRCPVGDRTELAGQRSHIMDRRGEGVPIIMSRSFELSGKSPKYRIADESELVLTIFAADFE